MSERRKVALAYVTKWAATRGIVVVMEPTWSANYPGHLKMGGMLIGPNHCTEDLNVAERRWREAVERAHKSAQKKAKALAALLNGPAQYVRGGKS